MPSLEDGFAMSEIGVARDRVKGYGGERCATFGNFIGLLRKSRRSASMGFDL